MLEDILPENLYTLIQKYVNINKLYEIRLRIDNPIVLNISNSICSINFNGLCNVNNGIICSKEIIEKVVALASDNSVYAIENQLKCGYITASCGIRIGVAGEFVESKDLITNLKNICSLNIRLPHNVIGCSKRIMPLIFDEQKRVYNTLILSPPGAGKTTMLRDIITNFSHIKGFINCLVIDERFEIIGKYQKKNYFELSSNIDVLYGGNKSYSIKCGVRSLAPNIIFTDEIATKDDANSIVYAKNCGVNVVATMHAKSLTDFTSKIELDELFTKHIFDRFVVLSNRKGVGTIEGVYDKNYRLLYGE